MMTRRRFLISGVVSSIAFRARATQREKVWRIGVLAAGTSAQMAPHLEQLRLGLRKLGYVEGQNILLEQRIDDGRPEMLPVLAEELLALKVDLIIALTTPAALAAKHATASVPIVMSAPSDPVGSGLIASLAHPGGNVTGQTDYSPEVTGRRIQILKELVPNLKSLAALGYPSDPVWKSTWLEAQAATRQLRIKVLPVLVATPDRLAAALIGLNKRVQGLFIAPQTVFWIRRAEIIALAAQERLPACYEHREFVDDGGLVSYGADYFALQRNVARYVDKIVKGTKPYDIPVEPPTQFDLVLNLKTANTLGLTIPPSIMASAPTLVQ
jgi:putative tryptophan/tyrosine transport system substrate-binding protein